jgi:hypothetical protein
MGVVYEAWQPQLARRVAIKIVTGNVGTGADDRRRWLREARAIGQVRHRNVVQIHEAGEYDGCLYLVLDLIAGGSLAGRITGPLPAKVAAGLMETVARAVDEIHRAGMLHLDIKPSNILLDGPPDGPWDRITPMIADFGIAWSGDDPGATATGPIGVRGTPSFMAPEQIDGDRAAIGPRSDVFALGATLYSMLTGRPPFQAVSVIETLDLVRTREPAPPRSLVPDLARDLETISLACLRKDPRRRYASAGALADDLRRWREGFPIQARPVSNLERAGRWCRRRPALASLLAGLTLTAAASLVGLLTLWRRAEAERSRAEIALASAIDSDKATSGAVRDLVGLLTTIVDEPQMLLAERLDEATRVVRDLTAKLRRDRDSTTSNLVAICDLESQLARALGSRGNHSEARALLMDRLELLEKRRKAANSADIDEAYGRTCLALGFCENEQRHPDMATSWFDRAGEALANLVHDPRRLETIVILDAARGDTAFRLGSRGLADERRKVLEAHIRMLESPSPNSGGQPDAAIGLLAALNRVDLAAGKDAIATLRAAIRRFPPDRRLPPELVEARLAYWIAVDVNPYPASARSRGEAKGRLDPEAHARAIIRDLESRGEALGLDPSLFHAAALRVGGIAADRGAEERNAGRLDDARYTAASFSAFAKTLVQRDANEAKFHLLMCWAFEQEAKNAWKVNVIDYATIERSLRAALAEASIALRLDPQDGTARTCVATLQDKLLRLTFGRDSKRPDS